MSKGIFITGAGTDIGKTYVTGLMVKKLRQNGINAGYYKPALSGAEYIDGERIPGDCKFVAETAALNAAPQELASYIYDTAVSPYLAAQMEGRPIDADVIVSAFHQFAQRYEYLTVEGCGGLVCPLRLDDKTLMQTDIIQLLDLDLLVITPSGLGSINSAVLTAHYAESQGITVKGFILNHYDSSNFLHQDNRRVIELLAKIPVVGCVADDASVLNMNMTDLCSLYKEI